MNGVLAGLVSITSPCAVCSPVGAIIIGLIGGGVYVAAYDTYLFIPLNRRASIGPLGGHAARRHESHRNPIEKLFIVFLF